MGQALFHAHVTGKLHCVMECNMYTIMNSGNAELILKLIAKKDRITQHSLIKFELVREEERIQTGYLNKVSFK